MTAETKWVDLELRAAAGGGQICVLTLDDPARRNALTVSMGEALLGRVAELGGVADLRAVVLTGRPPAFSAGGDLEFLLARAADQPDRNALEMREFYRRYLSLRSLPVPVIAAVNGHAIGAGLCLALAADLRVVAAEAKLGLTFVGLGLHPGMAATALLPAIAGPEVASWLLLTGDTLSGEEAVRRGLALEALPQAEVLPRALALAERMAAQAPIAVRTTTRSLRMARDDLLERALWREADSQALCYASEDLLEGIQALREKRTPVFRGH